MLSKTGNLVTTTNIPVRFATAEVSQMKVLQLRCRLRAVFFYQENTMQEFNRALEALQNPELCAQFERESDAFRSQMLSDRVTQIDKVRALEVTKNQRKRARRKARGVK